MKKEDLRKGIKVKCVRALIIGIDTSSGYTSNITAFNPEKSYEVKKSNQFGLYLRFESTNFFIKDYPHIHNCFNQQ